MAPFSLFEKIEWKVPIHKLRAKSMPTSLAIRSFISFAALFVNVSASIERAFMPCDNR